MKKVNINIIMLIAALAIFIATIFFLIIYRNNKEPEPLVGVPDTALTLNSIRDKFLTSDYASTNNCRGSVTTDAIIITCHNQEYNFVFNGYELVLESATNSNDVFKYLVNAIEELHGYEENEYLATMDKFLAGGFAITGLSYRNDSSNYRYSVYILEPLDKYLDKESINNETIKDLTATDYQFSSLGYTINNIEIVKDDFINSVILTAIIGGNDDYNVNFTLNLYDSSNNLLTSRTINLSDYNDYGNPYLGFDIMIELDEETFNAVAKYSIRLS